MLSCTNLSITIVVLAQLEQLLRILPTNIIVRVLPTQRLLNTLLIPIPPPTAVLNRLVRIINREKDPLSPHIAGQVLKRRRAEMPTSRQVNIILEVVVNILLTEHIPRLLRERPLDVFEPVVDSPEVVRDVLAQVADDDFQFGEAVEDAVGYEAEQVQGDGIGEAEGRADEVLAGFVEGLVAVSDGGGGVEVDGDVEFLRDGSEGVVGGVVVEKVGFAVGAGVLDVVEQGAVEA